MLILYGQVSRNFKKKQKKQAKILLRGKSLISHMLPIANPICSQYQGFVKFLNGSITLVITDKFEQTYLHQTLKFSKSAIQSLRMFCYARFKIIQESFQHAFKAINIQNAKKCEQINIYQ